MERVSETTGKRTTRGFVRPLLARSTDEEHRVSTPVNWQQGDDVIIAGSVSNDEAKEIWPDGWQEPKPYIRVVPQPN